MLLDRKKLEFQFQLNQQFKIEAERLLQQREEQERLLQERLTFFSLNASMEFLTAMLSFSRRVQDELLKLDSLSSPTTLQFQIEFPLGFVDSFKSFVNDNLFQDFMETFCSQDIHFGDIKMFVLGNYAHLDVMVTMEVSFK